jgi:hypothetical protein
MLILLALLMPLMPRDASATLFADTICRRYDAVIVSADATLPICLRHAASAACFAMTFVYFSSRYYDDDDMPPFAYAFATACRFADIIATSTRRRYAYDAIYATMPC